MRKISKETNIGFVIIFIGYLFLCITGKASYILLLICPLAYGIMYFAIKIFILDKKKDALVLQKQLEFEIEQNILKKQQYVEDYEFIRDVNRTARSDFQEWVLSENKLNMFVSYPLRFTYTIYHEPTAKYKNADYHELVKIRFNELKNEHEQTNLKHKTL